MERPQTGRPVGGHCSADMEAFSRLCLICWACNALQLCACFFSYPNVGTGSKNVDNSAKGRITSATNQPVCFEYELSS
uniref:Uncharacterized protein n=1 Tax=Anguilla anguilla TaxID=7936 RepID=A0A0E9WYF4_ANGAN